MSLRPIEELRETGRITWNEDDRLSMASPGDVVDALSDSGFCECKREEARGLRGGRLSRGVWQGIDMTAGLVASAVWINRPDSAAELGTDAATAQLVAVWVTIRGQRGRRVRQMRRTMVGRDGIEPPTPGFSVLGGDHPHRQRFQRSAFP